MKFRFQVTVETDTEAHASQVINERIYFDEEYEDENGKKFDYQIWDGDDPK